MLDEVSTWSEALLAGAGAVALVWAVMKRIYRMAKNVETVLAEMKPNGGGSMRDAVNRIETDLKELHKKQDDQSRRLTTLEGK
jgi:dihydroorotate dehydrogenase